MLVEKLERRKSWALVAVDDCERNCKILVLSLMGTINVLLIEL